MKEIEEKALTKFKQNNSGTTDLKDEIVKCLLKWYKSDVMKWFNSPNCTNCNNKTEYFDTHPPTFMEDLSSAKRTEVYQCEKCLKLIRFPRYYNPAKISQIKTGRCSEYANLFGSILRALDYDVRFVDNYEDHVWNEYWSEFHQRVIFIN